MEDLIQKKKCTNNRKILMKHVFKYTISFLFLMVFLFAGFPENSANAASGLKIYNYSTKKTTSYTGKQVKVLYNGKQISVTETPGIIVNGIALVSYKDIFVHSAIDTDFTYDKANGKVTISKGSKKITMTINSKNAAVNGKAVKLPVAPVKIKYIKANVTKILVPSRFVAETLGLEYTWYSNTNTVKIVKDSKSSENSLFLSYNGGEKFEYTGTKGSVSINGTKVQLGTMPGIILNNTALLRAKRVFADSKIDADYSYDKATKKITLSKDGNVLIMTVGSKTAYLNGKAIKLAQGPVVVKNYASGTSYVMVPGSVTATSLGYDYTWNKSTSTSLISVKKGGTGSTGAPELGGDNVIIDPGTVLYEWKGDNSLIGANSGVHELGTGSDTADTSGYIYSVVRDFTRANTNTETFAISGTSPFGKVTSGASGKNILIQASGMNAVDQTWQLYGTDSNFVSTATTAYDTSSLSTLISFQLIPEDFTYDLSISSDGMTLYVTIYLNTLMSTVLGTNDSGDYLTLAGVTADQLQISVQENMMYLDIPNMVNGIGNVNSAITGAKYITQFNALSSAGNTQLILTLSEGYEYYLSKGDNQVSIAFVKPNSSPETEVPSDIDLDSCEIRIPKPSEVTAGMISHEDYYMKHRFAIKISGDYTSYFNDHPVIENSDVITDVSVSLNSSGQTEILFSTSKLQGYKFASDDKYIYVHIGNPRDIYKNIVVLDPGHGGTASGAVYFGTKEKDNNLKILYTLGKKYFESDPWEMKVYYTRTTDVDKSLDERCAFAGQVGADLFVSLHMNASTASSAHGTEVYYSSSNAKTLSGMTSKTLATLFVNNLTSKLGTLNRGPVAARYNVVHKNTVPAVLIELGFLSNKSDHDLITNSAFQEKAVKEIYETLLQVFEKYPTGR